MRGASRRVVPQGCDQDETVLRLAADPASATRARHAAVALADELGASRDTRAGIAVAVTEAVANVVVHAYRGIAPSGVEIALQRRRARRSTSRSATAASACARATTARASASASG